MDPYMAMLLAQGVPAGLAARFAQRKASPAPPVVEPEPSSIEDQNRFFDDWAAEGRAAHVAPPPASPALGIFSNPGVRAERADERRQSELDRLALSHMPTYQQRMQGVESVPGLGAHDIGLDGGGAGAAGGLAAAASTPGPNAPIPPGQRPTGWIDPNDPGWQSKIAAIDRAVRARVGAQHADHPGGNIVLSRYSTNADRAPEFADVESGAPNRLTPSLQQDNPAKGRHWTLLAHEGIDPETKQKTQYGGGFVQDAGPDTPEQHRSALAGLAARAFHPQTYDPATMDVSEATHQKDLEGRQQDLAMRHMEAQIAREEAQARDPYGMGRFALEQAALNQRAQGRDQAGIERAMAADRTGLLERQDRESKAQKILAEYEQEQRTMDALEAQIPPDAPPDSPLRAHVAQGREYALNKRNAAGAAIGVHFPGQ